MLNERQLCHLSLIFGQDAAQQGLVREIENTVGRPVAQALSQMLAHNADPASSGTATIIGVIVLLIGAAAVFGQLQDAMNAIWRVERKATGWLWGYVRDRFFSLTMVMGSGFLLLISLCFCGGIA